MAQFNTLRFGTIDVPEQEQIEFRRGLLGFERLKRFVHLELAEEAPFGWLQSLEDPQVAFAVANPAVFFADYRIEVDPRELGEVRPGPNDRLLVLGVCTIPERFTDITMNLLGPLVINTATRRGKQVVLNRSSFVTQHRLVDGDERPPEASPKNEPHSRDRASARRSHSRAV